jgi:DNA-binding CsgD family transcriptional regulator
MACQEEEYTREIANLLDHAHNRPLQLLMAGFEALDLLNIGLAVTTASGMLLVANRTAEQITERRDGLELSSARVLRTTKVCRPALSELVQWAASAGSPPTPPGKADVVAVPRPSGKRALTLLVRPVKGVAPRSKTTGPAVLVFILDPEFPVEASEAELGQLYGLTSTEARLANLLMEGKTLHDCCDQLEIRRSTGRTHLQHLFEKVGAQRQSELVSLLLKTIGLLRTVNKERKPEGIARSAGLKDAFVKMRINRVSGESGAL